jgi:trehalose 6-phosphate phosphatase
LAGITAFVERMAKDLPGTIIERKALSIALHYRNAPRYASEIHRLAVSALAGRSGGFEIQEGKMVVEIKPRGVSKGAAIEHFMNLAPFRGRIPLFAGDDLTDESAFGRINARQGISIKIGSGPTQACWRLDDPPALSAWLGSLLAEADTATAAIGAIKTKDRK